MKKIPLLINVLMDQQVMKMIVLMLGLKERRKKFGKQKTIEKKVEKQKFKIVI